MRNVFINKVLTNNLLQLASPIDLNKVIHLVPHHLNFSGSKHLTQFEVKSYSFKVKENGSVLEVEIVLRRIFSYLMMNNVIPTTSLLVLVQVSIKKKQIFPVIVAKS
jgi:hypothetical protein